MRRITLTVVTTLAILVLLFSYRTSRDQPVTAATVAVASAHVVTGGSAAVVTSAAGPDPTTGQVTVPSTTAASTTAASTSTAPTTTAAKPSTASTTNSRTTAAKTTAPVTTKTTAPSTSSSATTKVDGSAVSTRYGDVQVEVTITGGRITDVEPLVYPNQDPRDQQINADALPQLQAQVLAAQSANIAGVSGATYTTEGYVTSLQSALDAAGFK